MLHIIFDGKPWFKQKRFGYGSGLPISWKGWVLLLSNIALSMGMALSFGKEGYYWEIAFVLTTLFFLFIVWKKTEGGWQFRMNGKAEKSEPRYQRKRKNRKISR